MYTLYFSQNLRKVKDTNNLTNMGPLHVKLPYLWNQIRYNDPVDLKYKLK